MSFPQCSAILVAAGAGVRMGCDKLLQTLDGTSVLQKSLKALLAAPSVSEVIVVCPEERWGKLAPEACPKPVRRVDGGATRQESVARGLHAVGNNATLVAVHDAARPLVSPADIERCIAEAANHGAATLARRAVDTMKYSDAENFSARSIDRDSLWCMETPQVFGVALLRKACAAAAAAGISVTDEVSAMELIGTRVKFVESRSNNLKITTPADLVIAEAILKTRTQP